MTQRAVIEMSQGVPADLKGVLWIAFAVCGLITVILMIKRYVLQRRYRRK